METLPQNRGSKAALKEQADQKNEKESNSRIQSQSGIGSAQGDKALSELAQQFDVHPSGNVSYWSACRKSRRKLP